MSESRTVAFLAFLAPSLWLCYAVPTILYAVRRLFVPCTLCFTEASQKMFTSSSSWCSLCAVA